MALDSRAISRHPLVVKWLSNHPNDFEIVNLKWNDSGHGPYLVRQDGCPPSDDSVPPEGRYFLMKDGTWMLNITFCNLAEKDRDRGLYATVEEIFTTIDSLESSPSVDLHLPEGMSRESMIEGMSRTAKEFLDKSRHYPAFRLDDLRG